MHPAEQIAALDGDSPTFHLASELGRWRGAPERKRMQRMIVVASKLAAPPDADPQHLLDALPENKVQRIKSGKELLTNEQELVPERRKERTRRIERGSSKKDSSG